MKLNFVTIFDHIIYKSLSLYVCVCECILVFCYFVLFLNTTTYHLRFDQKKTQKHSRQFCRVIYRRHLVCRIVCI